MLEFFQNWLPVFSGLLGIIITGLGFLIPFIQNAKAKKLAESALKLTQFLKESIAKAEEFVNYKGEEKKNYVLTQANQYAIENKLKFNKDEVSKQIDELVELTKKVNQRDKDKQAIIVKV